MNGIHDLGGMDGFGRVPHREGEPVFGAPWQGRVFAMANLLVARGLLNMDGFRHAIERLDPVTYLTAGYFGRWLAVLERLAAVGGEAAVAPHGSAGALRSVDVAPRFAVGAPVRARNLHPEGHTRLPRYVRGRRGTIARVQRAWVFPDTNAHDLGEHPQYVYAVRFDAVELWGAGADPRAAVHVDLFEDYLEPVGSDERVAV